MILHGHNQASVKTKRPTNRRRHWSPIGRHQPKLLLGNRIEYRVDEFRPRFARFGTPARDIDGLAVLPPIAGYETVWIWNALRFHVVVPTIQPRFIQAGDGEFVAACLIGVVPRELVPAAAFDVLGHLDPADRCSVNRRSGPPLDFDRGKIEP